jgi:hypothetical protein
MARSSNWHPPFLAELASLYSDCVYIEIGVQTGNCIQQVAPLCKEVHGVDIHDCRDVTPGSFWHMTSDAFFDEYDGTPDLVFVDGEHTYEQAKRDFENALAILAPGGTIVLHDTCPENERDMDPTVCGDVFRLREELPAEAFTFTRWPGLTLLRPGSDVSTDAQSIIEGGSYRWQS